MYVKVNNNSYGRMQLNFSKPSNNRNRYRFSGQEVRTGSCRKTPEINETWKQYSDRKVFGVFLVNFDHFLVHSRGNRPENHRKKIRKIPVGILLPFSIDFRRPESSSWVSLITVIDRLSLFRITFINRITI